jgi:hypothetical protein
VTVPLTEAKNPRESAVSGLAPDSTGPSPGYVRMSPPTSPGQSAPADPRTVRALETAIEALREQLTKADQRAEAERGRADRTERHLEAERKRVDELQAALADAVAAERIAAGEAAGLRAELDPRRGWGFMRRLRWAIRKT